MTKKRVEAMFLVVVSLGISAGFAGKAQEIRRPPAVSQGAPKKQLTPQEIRQTSVQEWFRRLGNDQQLGYAPFTVLNALIAKAKEGTNTCDEIIHCATETIDDPQQSMFRRWQCCYVLSGIGDPRGIPAVTRALQDQSEIVRGVAACALGAFEQPEARAALEKAAGTEQAPAVQKEIKKALRGEYRKKND
jgi:hypothetical protein